MNGAIKLGEIIVKLKHTNPGLLKRCSISSSLFHYSHLQFTLRKYFSKTTKLNFSLSSKFELSSIPSYLESVANDVEMLNITWDDGSVDDYPILWLRDNCQCNKCFHPTALARLFLMTDLKSDLRIENMEQTEDKINIKWNDGHESEYKAQWLKSRSFGGESKKTSLKTILWNNESMQSDVPSLSFSEIMKSDETLYEWLCTMEQKGLFLIRDSPNCENTLREFASRICFLKKTNYGELFTVKAKVNASNAAYTDSKLGLHTDLPFYEYAPGMQMLHCISQVPTKGGENQYADGFYIAELMKQYYPEHFETLTTIPVDFVDVGDDFYKYNMHFAMPVFRLNRFGSVDRISYNNQVRDSRMNVTASQAVALYKALKCFDDLAYSKENHIIYKLREGDIACFHNYRVLHGRAEFQVTGSGTRHLQGGYIDWDELHSKRRVLQDELSIEQDMF